MAKFEEYYIHSPDSIFRNSGTSMKVSSIINELNELNEPSKIKERLSFYLMNLFKYEEQPGDLQGLTLRQVDGLTAT